MKPSGTINMFKISVVLFVTLQQKNNWFSSNGRRPQTQGEGLQPWAGVWAKDQLLRLCAGRCGQASADFGYAFSGSDTQRAICPSVPGDNLHLQDVQTMLRVVHDRLKNSRTSSPAALPGHRATKSLSKLSLSPARPICRVIPRATHMVGVYKPSCSLSLLLSILRTQLSASLRGSLGRPEAPISPVLAWGRTNGKIFFPRLNPKWAAAAGLQSFGPSRFHFKCYLSWTVLANEPPQTPFLSSPHHLYQIFYPHMLWPKPGPTGVHIN